jgi:transposase
MDTRCDESVDGENFGAGILSVDSRGRSFWCLGHRQLVVAEALAPGASVAAVSRWYGLNANLVFKWIKRAKAGWPDQRRLRSTIEKPRGDEPIGFVPVTVLGGTAARLPASSETLAIDAVTSTPGPRKKREAGKRRGVIDIALPDLAPGFYPSVSSLLAFGLPFCWAVRAAGVRIPRWACGQSALALL